MQQTVNKIIKNTNTKHKTNNIAIYKGYGSNLQSLLNRYSGDYFSPSFMKKYKSNPAMSLMENFFETPENASNMIGTDFHTILEAYYNLPGEERIRSKLYDLKSLIPESRRENEKLNKYLDGYLDIKDYLHPRKELDEKNLKCLTEHKGRAVIHVKSINYTLPCNVSYIVDRIDYRDDEIIILDYKTGSPTVKDTGFEGYLGSMLLYKWAMEHELNNTIDKGYLVCPGNTASKKYLKLDFSKENEEKFINYIDVFYRSFIRDNRSREYE